MAGIAASTPRLGLSVAGTPLRTPGGGLAGSATPAPTPLRDALGLNDRYAAVPAETARLERARQAAVAQRAPRPVRLSRANAHLAVCSSQAPHQIVLHAAKAVGSGDRGKRFT